MFPYLLLFAAVLALAKLGQKKRPFRVLLFVVMTLFVGLRKDVGTDYESYSNLYAFQEDYLEAGFSYILLLLNRYGYSETYFFFVMAAISYFFMYMAVEKTMIFRNFSVLVMLPLLSMSFLCNGIRQGVAICIFLYAFHFIQERKPIPYFLLISFAFLFHKSILLAIPLYFLCNKSLPKRIYYLVYLASFIFTTVDLQTLVGPFFSIIESNKRYSTLFLNDSGSGYMSLGILLEMSIYIILILTATKKEVYKQQPLLYNMVFIAAVLMNMRVGAPLMNRVLTMFAWFCYPLIPIVLDSVAYKEKQMFKYFFILAYFLATIKYLFFDEKSMMYPYHDALGIF